MHRLLRAFLFALTLAALAYGQTKTISSIKLDGNIAHVLRGDGSLNNLTKLGSLTSNGFVKTGSGDGTLSVDTTTYLTSASGVSSITGTSNQITASSATGAVTLSVPSSAQLSVAKLTNLTTNGLVKTGSSDGTLSVDTNVQISSITFIIDGGGSAITTGEKGVLEIPFSCTINRATTLADQSGSIVIDIWKDTYANYPPTVADTITASAKPTLSSATKAQDATLTGWTTSVSAGDILKYKVDSASTVTLVTLSLRCVKP